MTCVLHVPFDSGDIHVHVACDGGVTKFVSWDCQLLGKKTWRLPWDCEESNYPLPWRSAATIRGTWTVLYILYINHYNCSNCNIEVHMFEMLYIMYMVVDHMRIDWCLYVQTVLVLCISIHYECKPTYMYM